jgi:transcriptional regulator with XRE-family HTH domain
VESIADRIRRMIEKSGVSAREVARRSGMSPTQISAIFKGLEKDPGAIQVSTLRRLAAGGGVSYEWLATGIERTDVDQALRAPRFEDLADWPGLLSEARVLEASLPEWVWMVVADSRPVSAKVTAGQVARFARLVLEHGDRREIDRPQTGQHQARSAKS